MNKLLRKLAKWLLPHIIDELQKELDRRGK
jgi:hypothetical protein